MFDVSWHYLVAVSVSSSTSPDIYFVWVSSRGFFHSFGSFIDALLPRCVFVFVAFLCTLNAWMSFWCVRELVVHSIVISVHRSPAWRMFLRGVFVAVAFLIPSSLFFFYLAFARNFHFTFFFMFVPFVWCTVLNQFLFSLYFRQRHQIGMERCVRHSNEESERECGNNLNYYDDDILLLHQSIGIVRCGDNDIVQTENVNWKRARKISSCVCVCMCVGATSTQMAKAETHECDCTENWFDEQESYLAFYLWIYSFLPQLECKIFPQMNWKTSRCGGGGGVGETTHS